jgi:hypothetical protein
VPELRAYVAFEDESRLSNGTLIRLDRHELTSFSVRGAEHLAHLEPGSSISQRVTGVAAGEYVLSFYAQGSVNFAVECFDAADASLGATSGNVSSGPIAAEADMAPFSVPVTAPAGADAAIISFTAGSYSILLDLVEFRKA